jgi:uncharacterized membrane protein
MIWVGGFGWGPGTAGLIITLVMFVVNAFGLYLVVRQLRRARRQSGGQMSDVGPSGWLGRLEEPFLPEDEHREALRILEERYVRGEIDREEFLQRREDLLSD